MSGMQTLHRSRRQFLSTLGALAACASPKGLTWAQGKRAVRFVVPVTAGAGPDLIARLLGPALQAKWDQPVVVENRPGASGVIAYESVAKAAPDGHTLLAAPAAMVTVPHLYSKLPYDALKSFTPITTVGSTGLSLVVHSALPVRTAQEFITYVKARPGQLNYASPGSASQHHLCMELLKQQAGLDIVHVPYKGAAGATNDLIAGRIPAMFLPIHLALPLLKAGQVRSLGVSLRERHPLFPDEPTLHEQGVTDYHVDLWLGIWAPANLPAEQLARINADLREVIAQPDMREAFARQGLIPNTSTPAQFAQLIQDDYTRWGKVIRDAKITAD